MTPADLTRARDVLIGGGTVAGACEAAGVSRRTLERFWPSYQGETLARWVKGLRGPQKRPAPVFFRLSSADRAKLDRHAEAVGVSAGELARSVLQEWLDIRSP